MRISGLWEACLEIALLDATLLLCPLSMLPDDRPGIEEPHQAATPQLTSTQSLVQLLVSI